MHTVTCPPHTPLATVRARVHVVGRGPRFHCNVVLGRGKLFTCTGGGGDMLLCACRSRACPQNAGGRVLCHSRPQTDHQVHPRFASKRRKSRSSKKTSGSKDKPKKTSPTCRPRAASPRQSKHKRFRPARAPPAPRPPEVSRSPLPPSRPPPRDRSSPDSSFNITSSASPVGVMGDYHLTTSKTA